MPMRTKFGGQINGDGYLETVDICANIVDTIHSPAVSRFDNLYKPPFCEFLPSAEAVRAFLFSLVVG